MKSRLNKWVKEWTQPYENTKRMTRADAAIVMITAIVLGCLLPSHITVSRTKSLPQRIYWIKSAPKSADTVRLGDFLFFRRQHPWMSEIKNTLMLKSVACLPGQRLKTTKGGKYFCNDRFLGKALKTDSKGRPLTRFEYDGIVPAEQFYMKGEHVKSYDSRYHGLVSLEEFENAAKPIL